MIMNTVLLTVLLSAELQGSLVLAKHQYEEWDPLGLLTREPFASVRVDWDTCVVASKL